MRRKGVVNGAVAALVGLLAVFAAETPAWSEATPSPEPSVSASASPSPSPSPEPTPPSGGTIQATVTVWSTSAAVTDGCVEAYNTTGVVAGSSCSPVEGVFSISGLPAGTYKVRAYNQTGMVPMWFGPAATRTAATPVAVSDAEVTPVAIRVVPPYTAVGKMVDGSGNPIVGRIVEAYNTYGFGAAGETTTGSDGTFVITSSGCGITHSCYLRYVATETSPQAWYRGTATGYGDPSSVPVSANSVTVLETSRPLAVPGTITGTLQVPAYFTSDTVCVVLEGGTTQPVGVRTFGTYCGARGDAFTFGNLPATRFYACVVDAPSAPQGCETPGRVNHSGPEISPSNVLLAPGTTAAMPMVFGSTLTVRSRLGSSTGPNITAGCVDLYTDAGALVDTQCGPINGAVTFTTENDVVQYRVLVRDVPGGTPSWRNGPPGSAGSPFRIGDGDANFQSVTVARAGTITGVISLPAGAPVAHGCVMAWDVTGDYNGSSLAAEACGDDATGAYSLSLPAGSYRLEFYAHTPAVASVWSGGSKTIEGAKLLTVTSGGTQTVNATLGSAGYIEATVIDGAGQPVSDGCFGAYSSQDVLVVYRCLDGDNSVQLDSLPAGTYTVYYDGGATHAPMWWGAVGGSSGDTVTVAAGTTVPVSFTSPVVGTVSLTVASSAGAPGDGGCVTAYTPSELTSVATECVVSGDTVSLPLPPGEYVLFASGWTTNADAPLADTWLPSGTADDATIVTVTSGTTFEVAGVLSTDTGVLSITAVYPRGANWSVDTPATGGCAGAYRASGELVATGCAADGENTIELHVPAGEVKVLLDGFVTDYFGSERALAPWWSGGAASIGSAALVTVAPTGVTPLRAEFILPTVASGVITLNGSPITDGYVDFYESATGDFVRTVPVGAGGHFVASELPYGATYTLFIHDVTGTADQFVGGGRGVATYEQAQAQSFFVSSPVSIALAPSGAVSGVFAAIGDVEGPEVCAELWAAAFGNYWPWYGPPQDWEFVDSRCGLAGEDFTFDHVVAGSYGLAFTDGAGGFEWHVVDSSYGTYRVDVVAGASVRMTQAPVHLSAPDDFVWGERIPIVFSQLHPSDGAATVTLNVATDMTVASPRTIQLTFVDGKAVYWLSTSMANRGLGDLHLSVTSSGVTGAVARVASVAPDIELTMPSAGLTGTRVPASITVDPALSGTATVWYQALDGYWYPSTNRFAVTNGVGSTTIGVPSRATTYSIEFGGGFSNDVVLEAVVPTVTLTPPSELMGAVDSKKTLAVSVSPSLSGTAWVWYREIGGAWTRSTNSFAVTSGSGSTQVTVRSRSLEYRVEFGGGTSESVTIGPVVPVVTLTPPAELLGAVDSKKTLTVSVSPSLSGTAWVWYREVGGTWVRSTNVFAVTGGAGSTQVTVRSRSLEYRVEFGGGFSTGVTLGPLLPTVTLTPPAQLHDLPGVKKTFSVSVSPASSGTAWVWYREIGGSWIRSSNSFAVTGGAGATQVSTPSRNLEYRVEFGGGVSAPVTLGPPVLTLNGPTPDRDNPGILKSVYVWVDPAVSGTAWVYYRTPGGSWTKSTNSFAIVGGEGQTWITTPTQLKEYRIEVSGAYSEVFSLGPVPPVTDFYTMQGSAGAPGTRAQFFATTASLASGTAVVWFREPGGEWRRSTNTFTINAGVGTTMITRPAGAIEYRVEFLGGYSNGFTLYPG